MQKNLIIAILLIIIGVAFFIPNKVACGVPGYSCAVPPISPEAESTHYYENQPLGITFIEQVTGQNTHIQYSSGQE